jgi:uncharacterized protein
VRSNSITQNFRIFAIALGLFFCHTIFAAEVIPPAPKNYFNDYAGVVSAQTAQQLNSKLEDFERATSSQIVVAVYPKMQSDSSIEDYTVRVAQSWRAGQGKDNGAVLFVFTQDHKMYLQVGYGLEGALPDALCKRIIDTEIAPRFKAGDFAGGLTAGVNAILAATKGEYQGTGQTVNETRVQHGQDVSQFVPIAIFILFMILYISVRHTFAKQGGTVYRRNGTSYWWWGGGGGGWGGGGGGGGGFSGGGGGFSGGGGSFGGGGAGGSW